MAGVVAPLEAHDSVRSVGEQIGDLSLAFVAPLGTDDHESGHTKVSVGASPAAKLTLCGHGSEPEPHASRRSIRLSSPSNGTSSHISVRRETVRSLICSHRASRSRMLVVITIERWSS